MATYSTSPYYPLSGGGDDATSPKSRLRKVVSRTAAVGMARMNRRMLEWIYFLILLTTVLLSWGYVIYATRLAAQWQLKEDYPMHTHNF